MRQSWRRTAISGSFPTAITVKEWYDYDYVYPMCIPCSLALIFVRQAERLWLDQPIHIYDKEEPEEYAYKPQERPSHPSTTSAFDIETRESGITMDFSSNMDNVSCIGKDNISRGKLDLSWSFLYPFNSRYLLITDECSDRIST
jgi:hypothetical protein